MAVHRSFVATAAVTLWAMVCVVVVLGGIEFAYADGETAEDFQCHLCREMVGDLRRHKSLRGASTTWGDVRAHLASNGASYCSAFRVGKFNPCDVVVPAVEKLALAEEGRQTIESSPIGACTQLGLCPVDRILGRRHGFGEEDHGPVHDMKVALAHGSRGYDFARISYVDNVARNHSDAFMNFFSYNAPFHYVWTEKWLHTTVVPINTSDPNGTTFAIGVDFNVTIKVPPRMGAVRGFILGDPCFNGDYVGCRHGGTFHVFDRLTQMLNVGLSRDVDTWALLGDNFYDPHGVLSPQFMQALSMPAKSKPMVVVPGNHDFWQHGSPHSRTGYDTYGNGYMQYWGTDTQASLANASMPFDFRVDPSTKEIAAAGNFFSYNMIGSLATITFSGAHHKDVMDPLFQEACDWVKREQPSYVFVLGHWSGVDLGCAEKMSTRDVHERIKKMPGCKEMSHRIKWFEGHQHCNLIVKENEGFRVAGWGMGGCKNHESPNFGVPYFDISEEGRLHVGYFPIVGGNGTVPIDVENESCTQDITWETFIGCIEANGLAGCKHLSVIWHEQSL